MAEIPNGEKATHEHVISIYGNDEKEAKYALDEIDTINEALQVREQDSTVFNGVSYSRAYEYNQKKAINYAPPKDKSDDREVSMGIVHEKIVSFAAIFLKYVFKRRIKCYNKRGDLIRGLGEVYDLAIEFSHKLEQFKKKIALIYWEVFTQGNAFILEDWEVMNTTRPKAVDKKTGEEVKGDKMDYTYEQLENLKYEEGEQVQTRRAVSRLLDGRMVIFDNPEIEEVQDQPGLTIEEELDRDEAEKIFGSLKRWDSVPKERENITTLISERVTLFDEKRLKDPKTKCIVHRRFRKDTNRFNIFVNGVMMLPRETPMTVFYPRGNYPLTNVSAERLRGSIYARAIPAKTKFNADFVDWALKNLALKFEQGVVPPVLAKGKYTLTRDIFRAGQVTHGVNRDDYEFALDKNGVENKDFNFLQFLKDIMESQTVNPTTSGELSSDATATEISLTEQNQRDKLGYMLDGLVNGFMDMALRRAETIESKYTLKQKEALVDGEQVNVYQNFTVNVAGEENVVQFNDRVGQRDFNETQERARLHQRSYKSKRAGKPTNFYLVNPTMLRNGEYILDIEIHPERVKDTQLQMIQMWDEFAKLINTFGAQNVNMEQMKKEYLEVSGRPDEIFKTQMKTIEDFTGEQQTQNNGSYGRPSTKRAVESEVMGNVR